MGTFRKFTPLIIPSVYDETISYLEQLACIYKHVNELGDIVNENIIDIEQIIDKRVQQKGDEIYSNLELMLQPMQKQIVEVEGKVQGFVLQFSDEIYKLEQRIDSIDKDLRAMVSGVLKELKSDLNEIERKLSLMVKESEDRSQDYAMNLVKLEKMQRVFQDKRLEEKIDNLDLQLPLLYNPFSGKKDSLRQILTDYYKGLAVLCITVGEYDDLGLTVEEYDSLGLTVEEYDIYSGYILTKNKCNEMFSPLDGKKKDVKQVVLDLCMELKKNAKTVEEYDAIGYTVEEFDESTFDIIEQDDDKRITDDGTPDLVNQYTKHYQLLYVDSGDGSTSVELENYKTYDGLLFEYEGVAGDTITKMVEMSNTSGQISLAYSTGVDGAVTTYTRNVTLLPNVDETILTVDFGDGWQNAVEKVDCCVIKSIHGVKKVKHLIGG